jgi:tetratricopeptide (TPR) repeat protein
MRLSQLPHYALDVELLKAKVFLVKKRFKEAKQILLAAIDRDHELLAAKILLSHVYLQEGIDWQGAQNALKSILEINPQNREAIQNLDLLVNNTQRSQ